jgi:cell division protein FtsB
MAILHRSTETTSVKILRMLLPAITTVVLAVGGSMIGTRVQMESLSASVNAIEKGNQSLAVDMKEMKTKQAALYEVYYLPTRSEWQGQVVQMQKISAESEEIRRSVDDLKRMFNNVHEYYPARNYRDGRRP